MCAGFGVLVSDLDGVDDADVFECFVPVVDALAHEPAVADWDGVFDVEDDWFFGRAEPAGWVLLFDVPAVDVADPFFVV